MKVALTEAFLRSLPSTGVEKEFVDARSLGLSLRVTRGGIRSWSFRFRDKITRKVERITLGRYPTIGLSKARAIADAKRVQVSEGNNPREAIRKARAADRASLTFDELADVFMSHYVEKQTPKSAASTRSYLVKARGTWSGTKAKDIDRNDVIAFLRDRADTAPVVANRTRAVLGKMFSWAIDEGILESTPVVRIPKPAVEKPRERVLTDDEFAVIWRAFETLEARSMALAFKFLAVSGQRPGEVIGMSIAELHDLAKPNARWEIPGNRTKNGKRHVVPLPVFAKSIVQEALTLKPEGDESPWVFVSPRNPGCPFDRHSFARAMKERIIGCLEPSDGASRSLLATPPTPHDLRRTLVTGLSRLGFPRETIKAVVNHTESRDVTSAVYDWHDRTIEKTQALVAWQRHIVDLLGAAEPSNVIPMRE